ncbi:MAG: alpha-glucan family phosphorylase [Candidatus Marinimicrobia bacterium]|nr:alpha-glucan family phosphorylase [Candidatus Neomarinimicrobiota bacterium]
MKKPIKSFTVSPVLPKPLRPLKEIAYNLRFSWSAEMRDLFTRLDMDLWESCEHNPVKILSKLPQQVLDEKAKDDSYIYLLNRVYDDFKRYMEAKTWYQECKEFHPDLKVAYFSMEYGISEALAIYSGGLGILSGDHLKSSSELGIPLVGVGLAYQNGYFKQHLNINGWQEEEYPVNDFYNLPMEVVLDKKGDELRVNVDLPGRKLFVKIWKAQIGRTPLFLLDTNIEENKVEDRPLTAELYGGDTDWRIRQEIVLGMGGIKALKAMGEPITVCHMNEGHSAFSGLERIRCLMQDNDLNFYEALEAVKSSSLFTTHTPVKAGIDKFNPELMVKYFNDFSKEVGISNQELLGLGRINKFDDKEQISMAVLAIRLSTLVNGVSQLHGEVAKKMWHNLWPNILTKEVPIGAVTNGIHTASWISMEMAELFNRYLGPKWREEPADRSVWKKVDDIPDGELWRIHEMRRARLVGFARKKMEAYHREIGHPTHVVQKAKSVLKSDALTIGFARRFATYKRATLIFRDPQRLAKILDNPTRPVQIIIAGKAHPQDNEGKKYISRILELMKEEPFNQNVVFLENYNMTIARYLVQGCDIWLNNPRRGLEACGTSGMKASANGCINCSTLDGWWDEIYSPEIGWGIGNRQEHEDVEYWDDLEANELYAMLEEQIVPMFYDRGDERMPRKWIKMMKDNMITICPIFNTNRMLQDYMEQMYLPAQIRTEKMFANQFSGARELASWKNHMRAEWNNIRFLKVDTSGEQNLNVSSEFEIKTEIYLGKIKPEDINVQVYYGKLNEKDYIDDGELLSLEMVEKLDNERYLFSTKIDTWQSGKNGFTLRILPAHGTLDNPFDDGLIYWFEE